MSRQTHAQKSKRETRMQPEEDPEFQIAPMIDILLVLLVFFMSISSTEVLQVNKEITLPVAKDAKDAGGDNPGQAIINITWNQFTNTGAIIIDERKFGGPMDIVQELQRRIGRNPMMRVLIRADRTVRYEFTRELLKAIGNAGVANVTFSVVDKDPTAATPAAPAVPGA